MPAIPVAFQRESIAFRSPPLPQDLMDKARFMGTEPQIGDCHIGPEMTLVAGADNDTSDLRPLQHGAARNGCDIAAMSIGDPPQDLKQMLEQVPAAEIIDDELVFGERPVLEGRLGLRAAEPAVAQETARHRPVAENMHTML